MPDGAPARVRRASFHGVGRARRQRFERDAGGLRGGQLNGQGEGIERLTDSGDDCGAIRREPKAGGTEACAIDEQTHGIGLVGRVKAGDHRQAHGWNTPGEFTGHAEHLAAGGDDGDERTAPEDSRNEFGDGIDDLLAIVQHEEGGSGPQMGEDRLLHGAPGGIAEPQGALDGGLRGGPVCRRGEIDKAPR